MSLYDYIFTDKTNKYVKLISIPYKIASKEQALEVSQALKETTIAYDKGTPLISDETWDDMYFWLDNWLKCHPGELSHTCIDQIYFKEVSKLEKVEHEVPLLSLNKTKSIEEIKAFCGDKDCIAMLKMDGLTCSLTYKDGKLIKAETRGNGYIGENIIHNIRVIKNVPHNIPYKDKLIVNGEIICTYENFKPFTDKYKNPRNFASGSIRLLNSEECYNRNLSFIAWDCIWCKDYLDDDWLCTSLDNIEYMGFETVPSCNLPRYSVEEVIEKLKEKAKELSYPIDGLVFKYNDRVYYNSLGSTSHHPLGALAYKFYDETYETILRDIEWTMGRTGVLTPVAIFDEVDTGDSIVTRANLHNISVMQELLGEHPYIGQKIEVAMQNMIIPQVIKADKTY